MRSNFTARSLGVGLLGYLPLSLLLLFGALASGCSGKQPNVAISLFTAEGTAAFHCTDAAVTPLSPEGGGFRFDCNSGDSMLVVYATGEGANGTIVDIITDNADERPEVVLPLAYAARSAAGEAPVCPAVEEANRQTGEAPLPMAGSHLAYGNHFIILGAPCGEARFAIGQPLNQ